MLHSSSKPSSSISRPDRHQLRPGHVLAPYLEPEAQPPGAIAHAAHIGSTVPRPRRAFGRLEDAQAADGIGRIDRQRAVAPHGVPEQLVVADGSHRARSGSAWRDPSGQYSWPQSARAGRRRTPDRSAAARRGAGASCGSTASLTYSPRRPRTRNRGPMRARSATSTGATARRSAWSMRHEDRVLDARSRPAAVDLREDALDRAEQQEALVDEVSAQVAVRAAGLLGRLAPLGAGRRPALEARLEAVDRPERAIVDQRPDGQEVAVPAPVLVDRQDAARACGRPRSATRPPGRSSRSACRRRRGGPAASAWIADRHVATVRDADHDHLDVASRSSSASTESTISAIRVVGRRLGTAIRVGRRDRRRSGARRRPR